LLDDERGVPALAVVVALLLALAASSPAIRRIEQPLRDLIADQLPAQPAQEIPVVLVDLGGWTEPPRADASAEERAAVLAERARSRELMARMLGALEGRDDLAIGLDLLLADETEAAADQALADVLLDSPGAFVGIDAAAVRDPAVEPLAPPFEAKAEVGVLGIRRDAAGLVRYYGLRGEVERSLAAVLARTPEPGLRLPRRPFRIGGGSAKGLLGEGWIRLSADEVAKHVDALPQGALVIVGVGGERGLELDPHTVLTRGGYRTVPGMELHALAAVILLEGRPAVLASWQENAAALLVVLALFAAGRLAARRWKRGVALLGRWGGDVALAALTSALGFVVSVAAFAWMARETSTLALVAAPWVLGAAGRTIGALWQRAQFRLWVAPLLAQGPDPLRQAVRPGFVGRSPAERFRALLDAYEEVVFSVVLRTLVVDGASGRRARGVRGQWHREHTLQTLLATLASLDRDARGALEAQSAGGAFAMGRGEIQSCLEVWRVPPEREDGADGPAPPAELSSDENWFVRLRNVVAHDTESWWFTERLAADVTLAFQARLLAILALPAVRHRLVGYRVSDGDGLLGDRSVVFADGEGDRPARSAAPWLLVKTEGAAPRLYRYRGVSKIKQWLKVDGQPVVTATYVTYGAGQGRAELLLPASEVDEHVPEGLEIGEAEWIRGSRRPKR